MPRALGFYFQFHFLEYHLRVCGSTQKGAVRSLGAIIGSGAAAEHRCVMGSLEPACFAALQLCTGTEHPAGRPGCETSSVCSVVGALPANPRHTALGAARRRDGSVLQFVTALSCSSLISHQNRSHVPHAGTPLPFSCVEPAWEAAPPAPLRAAGLTQTGRGAGRSLPICTPNASCRLCSARRKQLCFFFSRGDTAGISPQFGRACPVLQSAGRG